MKITYKWFVVPMSAVILGLLLRALGATALGDALCYIGGLTVAFMLIAMAVTGAQQKK